MDKIQDNLYVTNRAEAGELPEGEFRVLLLSHNTIAREHVQVAIDDAVPWEEDTIKFVVETISRWLVQGQKVCVACDAGISRSAGAVVAYLVSKGITVEDAVAFVKFRRPMANPHPLILESIRACTFLKRGQ
ncbi:MAG TPA: protein-tyrosine phosphatase family protein [Candidatus Hypogeohydataceae bacterium YC38]